MSKNRNYSEFYKKNEEVKADEPVQEVKEVTSEENQEAEEPASEVEEETPVEEKPDPVKYGMVKGATRVNMREQPNKDSKILAILPNGAKVKILTIDTKDEKDEDEDVAWEHIEFDGRKGYMMSQFVMRLPLVMGE